MKEFLQHNFIVFGNDMKDYQMTNAKYEDGQIIVIDKSKEAFIESEEIKTREFYKLTGSWCATTLNNSLVNLEISVLYNNTWSKYFTYGSWCLGGENLYYNQDDIFAHMDVDEIIMKDNLLGEGFKFRFHLQKDAKLNMICIAMKLKDYQYYVSDKCLPSIVDYSVPKLNQNMVPVIGHEMCSATTTTMLLKFKGMDFSKYDNEFEHRYVASLVADRGHNSPTFGNWVYNTAVIGAFGFIGYVARFYSWNELKHHLAKVGPVGASIAGDTGVYKTGGHLIVVRGYKEENGETKVICNDPNINSRFGEGLFVYYEFPLDVFMKFWRGVVYVVL